MVFNKLSSLVVSNETSSFCSFVASFGGLTKGLKPINNGATKPVPNAVIIIVPNSPLSHSNLFKKLIAFLSGTEEKKVEYKNEGI